MTLHTRKLLPLLENHDPTLFTSPSQHSPTLSPLKAQEKENPTNYYNNVKLNPPFDSAMALTVLVLLTALFFMGFFSIYIRRFADEPSFDTARRRRNSSGTNTAATSYLSRTRDTTKGVDPAVVESLPVYAYFPGAEEAKQRMIDEVECAICLSEFEEKEWIKEIPYCGHVFHVECIDTWLSNHMTCPLCRTAKLLTEEEVAAEKEKAVAVAVEGEERGLDAGEVEQGDVDSSGG